MIHTIVHIGLHVAMLAFSTQYLTVQAGAVKETSAFSLLGEPKYPNGFTHFQYVNPAAPKQGSVTLSASGTFDHFNCYALRGNPAIRTEQLYDSLFTPSQDEIGSYYPLIATSARYPDDYRWLEITLNPLARFHDGIPMSVDDVIFTFKKFMTEGAPQFRRALKGVEVKALSRLKVRFEFPQSDKNAIFSLISLPVIPAHFWQHYTLSEPLTIVPIGSGPWRISDYRMGQYLVYQRVKDYWAANLPVNLGQYNFDTLRYNYYLDDRVALEAFKAGAFDVREENSPKNWATQYQGKYFSKNHIIKQTLPDQAAQHTRWLVFNVQRPLFQDSRVRRALTLAFDFNWLNKVFYYDSYQRTDSFFQNTDYAARNKPDAMELAWLMPLKDKIPAEVFTQIWYPPHTDGSGNNRANLLQARALLHQAGWEIKNQRLVHGKTGQPFIFELLLPAGRDFEYVLPFQHSLYRLGITMKIRTLNSAQFSNRLRRRDFDMLPKIYTAFPFPNSHLQLVWSSAAIDSGYNSTGIQDTAIDTLIDKIIRHQGNPDTLLALGRALDRVLTWNNLMIPLWYSNNIRLAYWDKFSMPAIRPTYSSGFDSWWMDTDKAARLPAEQR